MDIQVNRTYPQNWRAYNAAQTSEKDIFQKLLYELCKGIRPLPQSTGRPRLPVQDAVFSVCFKIFSTVSGRRFMSDLRAAQVNGYITRTPHFNSIFNYLEMEEMTAILKQLIVTSSLPLSGVECEFAVDSSGFSVSRFDRWFDEKYGRMKKKHGWVKAHIVCGVRTHIVTAVEIGDQHASDSRMMPALLEATSENFTMLEVSADKAYNGLKNYAAIEKCGATPFIMFKKNHKDWREGMWGRMYHYFQYRREDFLNHYHKRSNVESVFSMIKAKFRDSVRSKTDIAMRNECMAKVLCHNICVLIQEMHELEIDVDFAQKPLYN